MARRSLQFKITLGVLIFSGLIFFLYYLGFANYSSTPLVTITNPLLRAGYFVSNSLGDFFSLYFRQKDLATKNEALKNQLISLARENATLSASRAENEILKKELRFVDEFKYHYLVARVIGRVTDYDSDYLLLDKGARDGLVPGLAVTINQGMIIGRLFRVEANVSQVELLSNNNSKIAITIIDSASVPGLATGERNLNLNLTMISKDAVIKVDDLVVTSNLNLHIPPGLVLGRVSKITSWPTDLWQSAVAEPLIDYGRLNLVTVILPTD